MSTTTPESDTSSSSKNGLDPVNQILAPLGVISLVVIVIVISYVFARRRRRSLASTFHYNTTNPTTDDDDDSVVDEEAGGLDEASIMKLPSLSYSEQAKKPTKDSDQEGACSICLVEFADSDTIRLIPGCEHYYHMKCVDVWLKMHTTCPICRQSLVAAEWSSTFWSPRTQSRLASRREYRPLFFIM